MKTKDPAVCEERVVHKKQVQAAAKRMKSDEAFHRLSELFAALGDPARLKILFALQENELCVCDIACVLRMSESAVSHHLRVLRNMRLVRFRKDGRIVYYSLNDAHVSEFISRGIEHVEE